MKITKKIAGFFIVEILVVLVIIGILITALLPNLATYTQRAQFVDNLSVAEGVKPAVEGCLIQQANSAAWSNCAGGSSGIPANQTGNMGSFVSSLVVQSGVITSTSTQKFGTNNGGSYTYTLTPALQSSGVITWTVGSEPSTCKTPGLC